jgi:hypothetical protein
MPKASSKALRTRSVPERQNKNGQTSSTTGLILEMIKRSDGASLDELVLATGWQKHSIRAAIVKAVKAATLKGLHSFKDEGNCRRYRVDCAGLEPASEAADAK